MHSLTIFLLLGASQALLVPGPPGPYSVAIKDFELVDLNRTDTLAPEANTKRRFMASVYLPIDSEHNCEPQFSPYMPQLTASVFGKQGEALGVPQGTVERFEMQSCNISTVKFEKNVKKKVFPVAVFSPGYGGSRLLYGALARSLASLGYVVFTVDHTYETYVVEFPDGSVAYAVDIDSGNATVFEQLAEIRAGDVSFLTSQLSNTTLTASFLANFPGTFNPQRVAVFGHSLGGSTAAIAAMRDPSVIGGINLDGPILGSVDEQGFAGKPFVLVATMRVYNSSSPPFPPVAEWNEFYEKIDAAKMELVLPKTQHYAFTDVPLLLTEFQVPPASQSTVDESFGTLSGKKVEKAQNEIMAGLLELLFHNNTSTLEHLDRNSDIEVVLSDLPKCN